MADKPSAEFVKSKSVALALSILFLALAIASLVRLALDAWNNYYPNPLLIGFDVVIAIVFALEALLFFLRYKELW